MRLTLAAAPEQITNLHHLPARTQPDLLGRQPAPFTASSRAGLLAGRRRRGRGVVLLLAVRRAEHGREALGAGRDGRSGGS